MIVKVLGTGCDKCKKLYAEAARRPGKTGETLVQLLAPDELRGRVLGDYKMLQ